MKIISDVFAAIKGVTTALNNWRDTINAANEATKAALSGNDPLLIEGEKKLPQLPAEEEGEEEAIPVKPVVKKPATKRA